MRLDPACDRIRAELSARLDGELGTVEESEVDEHLARCHSCRREMAAIRSARTALRVRIVEEVPDLSSAIAAKVTRHHQNRRLLVTRLRIAAVAAVVTILVLLGASIPWGGSPTSVARASTIVAHVQRAGTGLDSYRARFRLVEHGFAPQVPTRRLSEQISFRAPENLHITIRDHTRYPGAGWPPNNVELVASPRRWLLRQPDSCPAERASPCYAAGRPSIRAIDRRAPFDGASPLPTDFAVPLETMSSASDMHVIQRTTFEGRRAYLVRTAYRQAAPLISSLEPGGAWRPFDPLDRVQIWLDAHTWFPLQVRVFAARSPERSAWAQSAGLRDRPGGLLLSARAAGFSRPRSFAPGTFHVPPAPQAHREGFVPASLSRTPRGAPSYTGGLPPYRSGRLGPDAEVLSWAKGLRWLKATIERGPGRDSVAPFAQEVHVGEGVGYYEPADYGAGSLAPRRRIDIFGRHVHVVLESNLPRPALLAVASTTGMTGRPIPQAAGRPGGWRLRRVSPERAESAAGFVATPTYLPPGYRAVAATSLRAAGGRRTVTLYCERPQGDLEGGGIVVTQAAPAHVLEPSSQDMEAVRVHGVLGRWTPQEGTLEWIEKGVYRSVQAPAYDLPTALRIADGLR